MSDLANTHIDNIKNFAIKHVHELCTIAEKILLCNGN